MRVPLTTLGLILALAACKQDYDEPGFRRVIEAAYAEAHPGWTVYRKKDGSTWFRRGDQLDELQVGMLFEDYRQSGQSGTDFVQGWTENERAADLARRRTLEQAADDVIPIIKSAKWVQYQDLGAIGPARKLPEIRPWRYELTAGVFVVLGVPEEKLGFRFASMAEVERSKMSGDTWLKRATENLVRRVQGEAVDEAGDYRGVDVEVKDKLQVFDLANVDGVSALVLDRDFRKAMLTKFELDELGAAAPIRNVLLIFDPNEFIAVKPVRVRAHKLYDTQNHPGFRGLLKFDEEGIGILEPGDPQIR